MVLPLLSCSLILFVGIDNGVALTSHHGFAQNDECC